MRDPQVSYENGVGRAKRSSQAIIRLYANCPVKRNMSGYSRAVTLKQLEGDQNEVNRTKFGNRIEQLRSRDNIDRVREHANSRKHR